ncbi:hypothetical protein AMAG_06471 [Allomyces macrogynus ATCC 38327]|uniref:F-box domain-containing protein n=1 Tax=Allomyces macrogynus (strain ATCC 38327) TaxID=578462 RepID=A0A0L0SGM1_ALLM3|nr:hypothetical protein AMAG_06471 [Allomyces macrogynus ATCC 38327]|eukprot:KNE61663.1 hypothetical protein AMAG_06471 [Allomyces macrogynus ATCC 38327]
MREPGAPVLECAASRCADPPVADPANPAALSAHLALCLTDILALIFPYLATDPVALFRSSHVCRAWRSIIMDSHAALLWPAAYHQLPGLQCNDPPFEGELSWQRYRWLTLAAAIRDPSDWQGIAQLGAQLAETSVPDEHLVRLEQVHAVREYVPVGEVVARCPHFLGVCDHAGAIEDEDDGPREPLVAVSESCVVFEAQMTGHLGELQTRSVLQVQPFSSSITAAGPPPHEPFLIHGSPDLVEEIDVDGALTASRDPFFKSTGVTASRWMWAQSASHIDLYPQLTANLRIRVTHADQLRILRTSCCDNWLVVLYRIPLDWSISLASDPDVPWRHEDNPVHVATPCILAVYDLRDVELPHVELDRCLRLDASDVGITQCAAVWVPYEHGLMHTIVDPDAAHPFAVTDPDPWAFDLDSHQPCRELFKVVLNEQGDDRIVGQRLVVITFDVSDPTASPTLVAWQPYGIIPNHTTYSGGEPYSFAESGTCCSFRMWRIFGRILIGSTREGICCPPIQFARDDSGLNCTAKIAPDLHAALTTVTRAGFFAISVLLRESLLRAFHFNDDWEHVLERYLAHLCGHDPVLAAQYDLRSAEVAYLRTHFSPGTNLATLSHLVRPTPLHALAHLPRLPRQGTWYRVVSMHWTRQDRLVVVSRASPVQTPVATSSTAEHTAMTRYGVRVEVWDVAGMCLVKRVELPRTTEFVLGSGVPNPAWGMVGDNVRGGPAPALASAPVQDLDDAADRNLLLPPWRGEGGAGGPWDDAWVLDVLAQSVDVRREDADDEDGAVRSVYSPGTVLHVVPTCVGIVVVRSLGPMRGAAVEMWRYGRPRASLEGGL